MSLIQEALKRKREEEGGVLVPMSDKVVPPSAHPMASRPHKEGPSTPIMILRMACYLVVVAGALAGLWLLFQNLKASHTETASAVAAPQMVIEEVIVEETVIPVTEPVAGVPPPQNGGGTPPSHNTPAPEPVAPVVQQVARVQQPVAPSVQTGAGASPPRSAPDTQPTTVKKVIRKFVPAPTPGSWPEIRVMGVFERPDPSKSTAIVDGELEEVGTKIEGAKIIEVKHNGVVFSYRGEEKFVRVGRTTLK
jgi:hypothetical protein